MEFVMTIGDKTIIPNVGCVIVGGNPKITKKDTSNLCKRGDNIQIKSGEQNYIFKVLDINLSFSINEKVIISMHLEETENFQNLKAGDLVYKSL